MDDQAGEVRAAQQVAEDLLVSAQSAEERGSIDELANGVNKAEATGRLRWCGSRLAGCGLTVRCALRADVLVMRKYVC